MNCQTRQITPKTLVSDLIFQQEFYSILSACFGKIVVELKSVVAITDEHRVQILNYLKAGTFKLGLLVNFGHYHSICDAYRPSAVPYADNAK